MPIIRLFAPKTMRLLSDHRNASNFTCSHLDLKIFHWGETLDPCLQGREGKGREGNKGFLPLEKEGGKDRRGARWRSRGEEGPAARGLRGIDAPDKLVL